MSLDMLPHGEGANPKEASADLSRKVEALATRASKEAKKEHDQYDVETAHGKNLSKQREWSARRFKRVYNKQVFIFEHKELAT
jgi:hypothetical protein